MSSSRPTIRQSLGESPRSIRRGEEVLEDDVLVDAGEAAEFVVGRSRAMTRRGGRI